MSCYRARFLANDKARRPGKDYDHTFSLAVKPATICIVLSLAVSQHWLRHQLDVKNAFFCMATYRRHFICISLPIFVFLDIRIMCAYYRNLYMVSSSLLELVFYRFAQYILQFGFVNHQYDSSLFIYHQVSHTAYLLIYVDDIMITTSSIEFLQHIISTLAGECAMANLGDLNYFLSIFVSRNSKGMFLSQQKYALKILEKAHMLNVSVSVLLKCLGQTR